MNIHVVTGGRDCPINSNWHGIIFIIGTHLLAWGQQILIEIGRMVPFGAWTNSLDGFWKILKIAEVTRAQTLDFFEKHVLGNRIYLTRRLSVSSKILKYSDYALQ